MRRAVIEIPYLGPEPDRWRNPAEFALKNSQEADHFINLERVFWLDPLRQVAMSSIANSTRNVPRPMIILTTISRSTSDFSLTSQWKFMDD